MNAFIRDGGAFDAVADADATVRDPDDPGRILPAYDPGDHLHFNDAGMAAVADTVHRVLTSGPLGHVPTGRARATVPVTRTAPRPVTRPR